MNRVVTVPDGALLRLACKSEEGEQSTIMYDVDQTLVDELAYLMEAPKDERPGIFCSGREWIIDGRVMGSLCYDKRKKQHCWVGAWFVILESRNDSMNLLGPLAMLLNSHQRRSSALSGERGETRAFYALDD